MILIVNDNEITKYRNDSKIMKNDKIEYLVGRVIKVKYRKKCKQKSNKHFLKVVQGDALSLTSTVSILSMMKMGLQSLDLNFGRILVSKRALSGHWG